ncbi:MAG: VOC family protein, partial [Hyphomicrobiaceae bacterium]
MNRIPNQKRIFLDHVGWMVPDMIAAAAAFKRLGFRLTPFSVHGRRDTPTGPLQPSGTANRLAMLDRGYLEILTLQPGAASSVADHMRSAMARHVGVHLLAFTVAEAEDEARQLAARGISLEPTVHLRRSIEAEDGTPVEVAFTVVRAALSSFPEARVQILTHHTPEHMWQGRYLVHDNAISGLDEVVLAVDDPQAAAERFARFLDRPPAGENSLLLDLDPETRGFLGPLTLGDESLTIVLDRGRLRFMTKTDAALE